jgi:hypothetical protein
MLQKGSSNNGPELGNIIFKFQVILTRIQVDVLSMAKLAKEVERSLKNPEKLPKKGQKWHIL